MPRHLPPLNALRAFEAAARHLSFTRAAEQLHVTHAAISHQVKSLEAYLGVKLFRRLTREIRLTEAAKAYLPVVRDAFDNIAAATEQLAVDERQGPLTVSVVPSFGTRWLVPRLAAFAAAHPEIEVWPVIAAELVDFSRSEVDLAIRHGRGGWTGLVEHCIFTEDLLPVCAPELREDEQLGRAGDLARHTLLHVGPRHKDWPRWLAAAGVSRAVDADRGPRFPTLALAIDAAIAGAGVAIVDPRLVAEDIKRGRLVAPFALKVPSESAYYLVYPETSANNPKIAAFRQWLLSECGSIKEHPDRPHTAKARTDGVNPGA